MSTVSIEGTRVAKTIIKHVAIEVPEDLKLSSDKFDERVESIVLSSLWIRGNSNEDNNWGLLNVMNSVLDKKNAGRNKDCYIKYKNLTEMITYYVYSEGKRVE